MRTGQSQPSRVITMSGMEPVVINANQTAGDPTTKMNLGVNLPAEDANEALPLSVEYFGNLGTSESLDITFTPQAAANTWIVNIADSAQSGATIGEYTVVFDNSRGAGRHTFVCDADHQQPRNGDL